MLCIDVRFSVCLFFSNSVFNVFNIFEGSICRIQRIIIVNIFVIYLFGFNGECLVFLLIYINTHTLIYSILRYL